FKNLEPLDLSGSTVTDLTVSVDTDDTVVGLVTTTITANGANTEITFAPFFEGVILGTITGSLTINGDDTDPDAFTVQSLGSSFAASLTIDGKGDSDTISLGTAGAITLAAGKSLSLTAEAITFAAGTITTGATQSYTGNVTLGTDVTLNAAGVSFSGTINGTHSLTVNSSAATTFSGQIGNTSPLTSLITDAAGTTTLSGVATTGSQTYNDSVSLGGTYTTTNANITFAQAVTVTGDTTLAAGSGTITLGAATLADGVTLTLGTGGSGAVSLSSVTGTASGTASNVTFNVTGAVTVSGAIGT
ncbi:MAG: hypothetical protein ACKON9_04735, partial [Planctomycetaceae bacterium]